MIAKVTLEDCAGNEDDYEVGADIEHVPGGNGWASSHNVGEPDVSAPGCSLDESRIAPDPQGGGVLRDGWSNKVEEALTDAYNDSIPEPCDIDPDEYEEY